MSTSQKISSDVVNKVARLARIKLTDDEAATFSSQLSPVLEHIGNLNQLDTSVVEPTFQVNGLRNILREDVVQPGLTSDQSTSAGSKVKANYFVMPQTIDK